MKHEKQADVPNHVAKMLKLIAEGTFNPKPGTVSGISILHDDWCAALKGTGPCNCDPDVVLPD